MKAIERRKIEKAVRKEYKAAREWCRSDDRRYYRLMVDTEDGDIWSDVFLSCESWKVYHSETIQRLSWDEGTTVEEREAEYVEDAIRLLEAAGWTIE